MLNFHDKKNTDTFSTISVFFYNIYNSGLFSESFFLLFFIRPALRKA